MTALRIVGRVLKAVGLGLSIVGIALLDEEDAPPVAASDDVPGEDDDGDVHVMPAYGREHETSIRCWCHTVRERDEARVIVHRDMN